MVLDENGSSQGNNLLQCRFSLCLAASLLGSLRNPYPFYTGCLPTGNVAEESMVCSRLAGPAGLQMSLEVTLSVGGRIEGPKGDPGAS